MLFGRVSRKNVLAHPKTNSSIFSCQTRLGLQMGLASKFRWNKKTSFLAANTQDGFGEHRDKKVPQMYNEIYCCIFLCCGTMFLLEVLDILFRYMHQQIKNQQVTDSVRNLIMGHVWIFQPYKNPNTNLKNNTQMGHRAQIQASAMTIPVLWPEPCRKWVRWTEEKKLWIWRIWRDSGWMNALWSLVGCSLASSGIIGEHLELLNWQMRGFKKYWIKGCR